jgi:hypothetical protein
MARRYEALTVSRHTFTHCWVFDQEAQSLKCQPDVTDGKPRDRALKLLFQTGPMFVQQTTARTERPRDATTLVPPAFHELRPETDPGRTMDGMHTGWRNPASVVRREARIATIL